MAHKGTSSSYRLSTVSGFDLAWFSSLSSEHLIMFGFHGAILDISFSLPFSELSLMRLALDLVTNHCQCYDAVGGVM